MSEPETITEPGTQTEAPKTKGGRKRGPRKPKEQQAPRAANLKDWVRVVKSQANGLPNEKIHIIINEATGLVELQTQARAKEGSDEFEATRTQVFRVTSFEVINEPNRDPLTRIKPAAPQTEDGRPSEVPQ